MQFITTSSKGVTAAYWQHKTSDRTSMSCTQYMMILNSSRGKGAVGRGQELLWRQQLLLGKQQL